MKKLVLSLTVVAFALGSVLQAGEVPSCGKNAAGCPAADKAACCEKQKAAGAEKTTCPARDQAACAKKGVCPVAGKAAKGKAPGEQTVKSKDKTVKSGDQASAR